MADSAVLQDQSRLSQVDRSLLKFESALNIASGAAIFLLVCVATVNVLSRKLLNLPLPGFVDWVEQCMAVFVFFGLAYCQREGGHIRMEILVGKLRGRTMWLAEILSVLLMLLLASALIYGGWAHFLRSFDFGAPYWSRDSSIDIGLPLWPAKLIVPLSMALLWLRLAVQLWAYIRAFRLGASHPVAVPLYQDASAQAAREAEAVASSNG